MKVLSLCDYTGNMVLPWAEAGCECACVDLQWQGTPLHTNIRYVQEDVNEIHIGSECQDWDIVFAFPPCTHLAGSGARWWKDKGFAAFEEGLRLVAKCESICKASGGVWMIENPVGRLSAILKPNYYFNPCDYGGYLDPPSDAYTKKTCLWTGGGFVMPDPKPVEPTEGSKMHLVPPGPNRQNIRSATPMGFARAVFAANFKENNHD